MNNGSNETLFNSFLHNSQYNMVMNTIKQHEADTKSNLFFKNVKMNVKYDLEKNDFKGIQISQYKHSENGHNFQASEERHFFESTTNFHFCLCECVCLQLLKMASVLLITQPDTLHKIVDCPLAHVRSDHVRDSHNLPFQFLQCFWGILVHFAL